MVKKMWTAPEMWRRIPKPSLFQAVVTMSKDGMYYFRILEGEDIHENTVYIVEVRNVFGMLDQFCDTNTQTFSTRPSAYEHYYLAKDKAKAEYQRLKEKQEKRIKEHDHGRN